MLTTSPLSICRSMPLSTSNEPKLFLIFFKSIISNMYFFFYSFLYLLFIFIRSTHLSNVAYALSLSRRCGAVKVITSCG